MKKAKVLKLRPPVIGNISNETFTPSDNDGNKWAAYLEVNNTFISFKTDAGSQENKLPI